MSMDFDLLALRDPSASPIATVLSMRKSVGGWDIPDRGEYGDAVLPFGPLENPQLVQPQQPRRRRS